MESLTDFGDIPLLDINEIRKRPLPAMPDKTAEEPAQPQVHPAVARQQAIRGEVENLMKAPQYEGLSPYEKLADSLNEISKLDVDRGTKRAARRAVHEMAYEQFKKSEAYASLPADQQAVINKGSHWYDLLMSGNRLAGTDDKLFYDAMKAHIDDKLGEDTSLGLKEAAGRAGWTVGKLASDLVGVGYSTLASAGEYVLDFPLERKAPAFSERFASNWADYQSNFISDWFNKNYEQAASNDPEFARISDSLITDIGFGAIPGIQGIKAAAKGVLAARQAGTFARSLSLAQKANIMGQAVGSNVVIGQAMLAGIDKTVQELQQAGASEEAQLTVAVLGGLALGVPAGVAGSHFVAKGAVRRTLDRNIGEAGRGIVPQNLIGAFSREAVSKDANVATLEGMLANPYLTDGTKEWLKAALENYSKMGVAESGPNMQDLARALFKVKNNLPTTEAERIALRRTQSLYLNNQGREAVRQQAQQANRQQAVEAKKSFDAFSNKRKFARVGQNNSSLYNLDARKFVEALRKNITPDKLQGEVGRLMARWEEQQAVIERALNRDRVEAANVQERITSANAEAREAAQRKPAKRDFLKMLAGSRDRKRQLFGQRKEADLRSRPVVRELPTETNRQPEAVEAAAQQRVLGQELGPELELEAAKRENAQEREASQLESLAQQFEVQLDRAIPTRTQSMREVSRAMAESDEPESVAATAYVDSVGKERAIAEIREEMRLAEPERQADLAEQLQSIREMPEARPSERAPEPVDMDELPLTAQIRAAETIEALKQGKEELVGRPLTEGETKEIKDNVLSHPDAWNGRNFDSASSLLATKDGSALNAGFVEQVAPNISAMLARAFPDSQASGMFKTQDFIAMQNGLVSKVGFAASSEEAAQLMPLLEESFQLWDLIKSELSQRVRKDKHGRILKFRPDLSEAELKEFKSPTSFLDSLYKEKSGPKWTNRDRGRKVLRALLEGMPGVQLMVRMGKEGLSPRAAGMIDYVNGLVYVAPDEMVKPAFLHELGHAYFMYALDAGQKMEWLRGMRRAAESQASWDRAFPGAAIRRELASKLPPDSIEYAYNMNWLNDPSEMFASQVAAYMHDGIIGTPEITGMLSKVVNGIKQFFVSSEVLKLLKGSEEANAMVRKFMLMPDPADANKVSADMVAPVLQGNKFMLPKEQALEVVQRASADGYFNLVDARDASEYVRALAYDRLYDFGLMKNDTLGMSRADLIAEVDRFYQTPEYHNLVPEDAYSFLKQVQGAKGDIKLLTNEFIAGVHAAHEFANLPNLVGKNPSRGWASWGTEVAIRTMAIGLAGLEPDSDGDLNLPFIGRCRWNVGKMLTSPYFWLAVPGSRYALKYGWRKMLDGKEKMTKKFEQDHPSLARIIHGIDDGIAVVFDPRQGLARDTYEAKRKAQLETASDLQAMALWAESLVERFTPAQLKAASRYYDGFLSVEALKRAAESGPRPTTLKDLMGAIKTTKNLNIKLSGRLGNYADNDFNTFLGRFYKRVDTKKAVIRTLFGDDLLPKVRLKTLRDNRTITRLRGRDMDNLRMDRDTQIDLGDVVKPGARVNIYALKDPRFRGSLEYAIEGTSNDAKLRQDARYKPMYVWKEHKLRQYEYLTEGAKIVSVENDGVVLKRNFSIAERKFYGEFEDLALRVGATAEKLKRDLLVANFAKSIANDGNIVWQGTGAPKQGEWDAVPFETDAKSRGFVYGPLTGKFVRKDVGKALQSLAKPKFADYFGGGSITVKDAVEGYSRLLSAWKASRTIINPVSHFNNFCSNVVMGSLLGHNPVTEFRDGIEIYKLFLKDAKAQKLLLEGKVSEFEQMRKEIENDKNWDVLRGAQEFGLGNSTRVENEIVYKKSYAGRLANLEEMRQKDPFATFEGETKGFLRNALEAGYKVAQRFYEGEDLVFKFGAFKQALARGKSRSEAAEYAYEAYFDYGQLSRGAEMIRDSGFIPFISYIYKAFPAILKGMWERPARFLFFAGLLETLNMMGLAADYGSDDLLATKQAADRLTPSYLRDYSMGGLFRNSVNLGGEGKVLKVQRLLPFGDFFLDRPNENDDSGTAFSFQFLAGLLLSNPISDVMTTGLTNYDPGLRKSLVPERNNMNHPIVRERMRDAMAKKLWNTIVPNLFFIPFTYSWDTMMNAAVAEGLLDKGAKTLGYFGRGFTGMDYAGRPVSSASAALSLIGVKLHQYDFEASYGKEKNFIKGDVTKEKAYVKARRKDFRWAEEDRKELSANLKELRRESREKVRELRSMRDLLRLKKSQQQVRRTESGGTALPGSGS